MKMRIIGTCFTAFLITGCGIFEDASTQGDAEGTVEVHGRQELEQVAKAKLEGDLNCSTEGPKENTVPIECSGKTQDGKTVGLKGTVSSVAPDHGNANGDFSLTVEGREVAKKTCIGIC